MGTRALTHVYDDDAGDHILATIYRQYDGYPEHHGLILTQFCRPLVVTNGLGYVGGNARHRSANGMGDVAVRLIAHLKRVERRKGQSHDWAGNIYLVAPGSSGMGEEYVYYVSRHGRDVVWAVEGAVW